MERQNYLDILDKIKGAKSSPPGNLKQSKAIDSRLGHTVINISDVSLNEDQLTALQKGLTFFPTPGPANKAKTWLDFKEFYRRLCLKYHFNKDSGNFDHSSHEENKILEFLASNLEEAENPYGHIHGSLKKKHLETPNGTPIIRGFPESFEKRAPKK